jgi:hypothetical protein
MVRDPQGWYPSFRYLVLRWSGLRAAFLSSVAAVAAVVACIPDYDFVDTSEAQHCENNLFQPELGETALDCGGIDCKDCELGQTCLENADCREGECLDGYCQEPGCDNGIRDNTETDFDCGGDCKPCGPGQRCDIARDCDSLVCTENECVGASCDDEIQNGDETGRDCGGSCDGCPPGSPCLTPIDCTSGVCDETTMRCIVFCIPGTDECDADLTVECETNILTSVDHCGGCGMPCEFDHAASTCVGGVCSLGDCEAPWADCNGDPDDGCEIDTSATATDCGGCGDDCPAVNGTPGCADSVCTIECSKGFEDCNEDTSDGCEAPIGDVLNCGGCGVECPEDEGYTAYCSDGECGQTMCEAGLGNCDGDPDDGCESDLTSDVENCGRCGGLCSVAHGTAGCDAELGCVVAGCDDGWANCNADNPDGGYADGCEVNTLESADDCGSCGNSCSVDNGSGRCLEGDCAVDGCDDGFDNCDGEYETGCETNIWTDKTSCGGCGAAGLACDDVFPNATGVCQDGACQIDECEGNFRDCTAELGCETNINSSDLHCGACGTRCQDVGGTNTCSNGTCMLTCDDTHASCDMLAPNGCETAITGSTAVNNCGDCDTECSRAGTSYTTCNASGVCLPNCDPSYANCDSNPANGCETETTGAGNEAHCGGCSPCSTAGAASVMCNNSGVCVPTCTSTRLNCNSANDGCEVTQGTSNCGSCGKQCLFGTGSPRHSTASTCTVNGAASTCAPTCEAGWGACSAPENGCTTQLNANPNCGVCGKACSGNTGSCVATSGTYYCQAAITFRSEVHAVVNGNAQNVTLNLQSGANRLVLVGVIAGSLGDANQGITAARPDSVTYDNGGANTPMTLFGEIDGNAGLGSNAYRQTHIFYYYLVDASLGANGNKVIRVNGSTSPSPNSLVVSAAQFDGVRQATPLVSNAAARSFRTAMNADVTGTVTLPISGSVIYSMASAYYAGNVPIAGSPGSSFVSTIANSTTAGVAVGDEGGSIAVAGYRGTGTPLAAGDYTVGWRYFYHQQGYQFLVALVPAQAP